MEDADHDREQMEASNEELQSLNEELRSLAEELETSKEELQSVNEELTTANEENVQRVEELSRLSADLQHLLESTGIATLFLDRSLQIVRFTPQADELFNVRYEDRGRPLADLTHRLGYDQLEADARHALEAVQGVEREVRSDSGCWYLMRLLPYRTSADMVEGVVITLIDITDRKRAEQALQEADRRKDEFLATLAHELRNPLAPICTGLELLKMTREDPERTEDVRRRLERQTRQLVHLVDDLLDVSRITRGVLPLRRSRVELSDIVRDAVAASQPFVEQPRHELEVHVPDEPLGLHADAMRLTQVLSNLLSNAAKYTPEGGRISLVAWRQGNEAVVSVRDTGIGIPSDMLDRIFVMFAQVENEREARLGGLGIGLTLARSLVEMHGGTLTARSAGIDRGSVRPFVFRARLTKGGGDRGLRGVAGGVGPDRVGVAGGLPRTRPGRAPYLPRERGAAGRHSEPQGVGRRAGGHRR